MYVENVKKGKWGKTLKIGGSKKTNTKTKKTPINLTAAYRGEDDDTVVAFWLGNGRERKKD